MYWKAIRVRYEGDDSVRVGIRIYPTLHSEPILNILGALECSGVKRKWTRPMKIKRWLLYNPHSHSYATRFLNITIIHNDVSKIVEVGDKEMLYGPDQDIIAGKFPSTVSTLKYCDEWGPKKKKKKRK